MNTFRKKTNGSKRQWWRGNYIIILCFCRPSPIPVLIITLSSYPWNWIAHFTSLLISLSISLLTYPKPPSMASSSSSSLSCHPNLTLRRSRASSQGTLFSARRCIATFPFTASAKSALKRRSGTIQVARASIQAVDDRIVDEGGERSRRNPNRVLRVGVICGGPSAERGISLNSARSVLDHIQVSV